MKEAGHASNQEEPAVTRARLCQLEAVATGKAAALEQMVAATSAAE
jgi:hypothetical protein